MSASLDVVRSAVSSSLEASMSKCLFSSFHFKGDRVEPGNIFFLLNKLSRVDRKSLSNPIRVGAGKSGRLVDVAVKRQKRLVLLNEDFDGSTSN